MTSTSRPGGDGRHQGLGLRALLVAWLTTMWVLLWGDLSPGNLVGGALLAVLVLLAFPPLMVAGGKVGFRPWWALRFVARFAWALVVSSVTVALAVVAPKGPARQRSGIVAVPLRTSSARLTTLVANSITLTPGTLTVDAKGVPATLYVHAMSMGSADQVRADVEAIEDLVVRAFGSVAEVARLTAQERKAQP